MALSWDPAVVEPVGYGAGEGLAAQDVVLLSGAPGSVDAVSFAGTGNGLVGEGTLATILDHLAEARAARPGLLLVALDLPTGVDADTGRADAHAVAAEEEHQGDGDDASHDQEQANP